MLRAAAGKAPPLPLPAVVEVLFSKSPAVAVRADGRSPDAKSMARIVLIDDEANLLRTLARFLERDGHEVVTGDRFAAVEAALQPGAFDVLVTDIVMPDFDGLAVLGEVVERRGCREPVVLMTGLPTLESASEAVRRGAFDYLAKPVAKERLLEVVARGLKHVQLVRERDHARQKELDLLRHLALLGEQASLLSHEIRTPITSLRHALRAVGDKLGLDDRVLVEDLVRNIERIERLLAETLSFARPLELRPGRVDLAALVADAIAAARTGPAAAAIRIDCDGLAGLPPVRADAQLLLQVVVNLVRNAAEACEGRGRIAISGQATAGEVALLVADDGPGVPAARRDEIFRPFHSSKAGGTGIGLAFSRKVVEAHGGSLDLVARTEPGACFRLRLPGPNPTDDRPPATRPQA